MNRKDFIRLEQSRADAFNLFAALLCQPEDDMQMKTEIYDALEYTFEIIDPALVKDVVKIREAVNKYSEQELLIEYARLLIGPFKVVAPPYSSLYFGSNELMSDVTIWVINFYNNLGLEIDEKIKDLPDHVAVETEFMYYLIYNEIKALKKNESDKSLNFWENQTIFFNKHYKKWVPMFCKKVSEETNNEYYKALSACLDKFVSTITIPAFPAKTK